MTRSRGRAQISALALVGLLATAGASACSSPTDGAAGPSSTASGSLTASSSASASTSTATPSPSVSMPASLTPAQAKAAASAIEAYRQYTLVLDQVRQNGGEGSDLLKTVAIHQALTSAQQAAVSYQSKRYRLVGDTRVTDVVVRSVSLKTDPKTFTVPEVILDTCEDTEAVDVVDGAGISVRPIDVPPRWKTVSWIRYYPDQGSGVDGWVQARRANEGVQKC